MRLLLTALTVLTLTACKPAVPADNGAQPNAATIEDELQKEQANEAIAIQNEAAADNENVDLD